MAKKLKPIHPGEILREEFMQPMGLQTEYDLRLATQAVGKQIEERVHPHAA
jgi:plasmid maintenance system antidote protein VapI